MLKFHETYFKNVARDKYEKARSKGIVGKTFQFPNNVNVLLQIMMYKP